MLNAHNVEDEPGDPQKNSLISALRVDSFISPEFCPLPSYDNYKRAISTYLGKNLEPLVVPEEASHQFEFEIEIQDETKYRTAHTIPSIRARIAPDLRKKPLRTMAEFPRTGPKGKVEVLPLFF